MGGVKGQPSIWRKAISWLGFGSWGWGVDGQPVSQTGGVIVSQVNERAALMVSTVYSCVTLYSGLYASLPIEVHLGSEANSSRTVEDHPLVGLLNLAPNMQQTACDFFEFIGFSLELWQNAYVKKQILSGRVVGLVPLDPSGVRAVQMPDGMIRYKGTSDGETVDLSSDDVIHIRGAGGAMLGAAPLLHMARDAIQFSRDAQSASLGLMQNGMRPSGALSIKDALTPQQRAQIEEPLANKFMGSMNAGRPMVLDNGTTWTPFSIDPEKAQMLESRSFSVEEICRFWGVPPVMIGHNEKQTSFGTGVEQLLLGFYKTRLSPRLRKIEKALSRGLLSSAEKTDGYSLRFSMDDLLRGDTAARAGFYKAGREGGWLSPDEIRGWEGLPSLPDGQGLSAAAPAYAAASQPRAE